MRFSIHALTVPAPSASVSAVPAGFRDQCRPPTSGFIIMISNRKDSFFMIKMIASDLDGTLLLDSRTVSARNRMALTRAAASGIEVVIASGRVLTSLPETVFRIP